jgi:hypothetical protein
MSIMMLIVMTVMIDVVAISVIVAVMQVFEMLAAPRSTFATATATRAAIRVSAARRVLRVFCVLGIFRVVQVG